MAIIPYRDYEIETYTGGYLGWNVEIRDPRDVRVETLARDQEIFAIESARAFVDRHVKENPVAVLRLEGDTNDEDIDETDHTVWTYASTQPVYVFLNAVTELFINCSDGGETGKTFQIQGTKSPGATIPFEEIVIEVTLDGGDAATPVSLAASPGSPTTEDIYDIRQIRPLLAADAIDPSGGGEIFVASSFGGGGAPTSDVYGHLATTTRGRNLSAMGVGTVPAGFEATINGVLMGPHEDAAVWTELEVPGLAVLDSFRLPLKSAVDIANINNKSVAGTPTNPSRYPPGTRFSLMAHAKQSGGVNQTRVGGTIILDLFRITA